LQWMRPTGQRVQFSSFSSVASNVILSLVELDFVEQSLWKAPFQAFPESDNQHLSSWDDALEPGNIRIEVFMINPLHDLLIRDAFHLGQVHYHTCARVRLTAYCDLQDIVVSMPVWIRTFIVDGV